MKNAFQTRARVADLHRLQREHFVSLRSSDHLPSLRQSHAQRQAHDRQRHYSPQFVLVTAFR